MREVLMLLVYVFFPLLVFGDTGNTITLAAGLTVEPYIIEAEDSGFESDIVRESFALEGRKVRFVYQPLRRTKISFQNGTVDGVMTIKAGQPEIQNSFVAEEYITYHNFAVTLQSRNLKISTVSDLKDKNIYAFQQARLSLGKTFELMAENNSEYMEMANQKNQIVMLFSRRIEVIVLDSRIFKYHYKKLRDFPGSLAKNISFEEPVIFHDLFESSSYRMAFKTENVRDVFDRGLKKLKESGRYIQIIESYVEE